MNYKYKLEREKNRINLFCKLQKFLILNLKNMYQEKKKTGGGGSVGGV